MNPYASPNIERLPIRILATYYLLQVLFWANTVLAIFACSRMDLFAACLCWSQMAGVSFAIDVLRREIAHDKRTS